MSTPYVKSAVNGMIIPLLPGQAGILHRFNQPENRLVVAGTSETLQRQATPARPDTDAKLVLESTPEASVPPLPAGVVPGTAIADPDAEMHERMAAASTATHTAPTPVATPPVVPAFAPPPLGAGFTPPALPGQ